MASSLRLFDGEDDGRLSSCGSDGLGLEVDLQTNPYLRTPNLGPLLVPQSPDDFGGLLSAGPNLRTPNGKLTCDSAQDLPSPTASTMDLDASPLPLVGSSSRHAFLPDLSDRVGRPRAILPPPAALSPHAQGLRPRPNFAPPASSPINVSVARRGVPHPLRPAGDSAFVYQFSGGASAGRHAPSGLGCLAADFDRPPSDGASSSSSPTASLHHAMSSAGDDAPAVNPDPSGLSPLEQQAMMRQQQPQQQAMRFADAFASMASGSHGGSATTVDRSPVAHPAQPMMTSAWSRSISGGLGGVGSIGGATMRHTAARTEAAPAVVMAGALPPHLMGGVQPHGWAGLDVPAVAWVDEWLSEVNS